LTARGAGDAVLVLDAVDASLHGGHRIGATSGLSAMGLVASPAQMSSSKGKAGSLGFGRGVGWRSFRSDNAPMCD
jgi:hypothetical protein